MTRSRRQILGGCLSAGTLALAGCTGGTDGADNEPDGEGSGEGSEALRVGDRFLNSSFPMEIYDPGTDTRLAQIHWHGQLSNSHWHQQPLGVPLDRWEAYEMRALDRDGNTIQLGDEQPLQLAMARTEETPADLLEHEITGSNIDIRGLEPGDGQYVFRLLSGEEIEWESPLLQISVD